MVQTINQGSKALAIYDDALQSTLPTNSRESFNHVSANFRAGNNNCFFCQRCVKILWHPINGQRDTIDSSFLHSRYSGQLCHTLLLCDQRGKYSHVYKDTLNDMLLSK